MTHSVFLSIQNGTHYKITEILLLVSVFCAFAWYLGYLWSRRRLYVSGYKLPGPISFPIVGSALSFLGNTSDIFGAVQYFFNKYPKLFRVWFGTQLCYCVSHPKYMDILLTHPQALHKGQFYRMLNIAGDGLVTAPVPKWKRHRKIILPTFNPKILEQFVQVFSSRSDEFATQLESYSGKGEFDVFHVVSSCTMSIICETAMGVKIQNDFPEFSKWVDRICAISFMRIFNIQYHNDTIFAMSSLGKEKQELRNKINEVILKIIQRKRNIRQTRKLDGYTDGNDSGHKWKPFLDLLMELKPEESYCFTDEELRDEVMTFVVAGTDTSGSSNCFALTMLGMHQDIQQKVYEEIIQTVGLDRPIDVTDLPKLQYLERVIKETLRLFPVAFIVTREAAEDIKLEDNISVVTGSLIVFGIYTVHRDATYWPNPLKFDPDRFLPEQCAKRELGTYAPFSLGPRNCIGMRYAMMAMKILLACIIRKYRISTSYKSIEEIDLKANLFLRPANGFKVSIERR